MNFGKTELNNIMGRKIVCVQHPNACYFSKSNKLEMKLETRNENQISNF